MVKYLWNSKKICECMKQKVLSNINIMVLIIYDDTL